MTLRDITPDLFGLSQQTTVRAMVDVLTKARITAVIEKGKSAEFLIIKSDTTEQRATERIKIKVRWYRSLPTSTWLCPLAATIQTSIDDIEERERAAKRAGRRPE